MFLISTGSPLLLVLLLLAPCCWPCFCWPRCCWPCCCWPRCCWPHCCWPSCCWPHCCWPCCCCYSTVSTAAMTKQLCVDPQRLCSSSATEALGPVPQLMSQPLFSKGCNSYLAIEGSPSNELMRPLLLLAGLIKLLLLLLGRLGFCSCLLGC